MNPQDPLANLHPLREPASIGWWPLAPGWWLLAAIVLTVLAASTYFYLRHRRATAYRRQAVLQLEQLYLRYRDEGDTAAYASAVNALLKRVAITAYPQADVAALHGRDWLDFLHTHTEGARFNDEFTEAIYRSSIEQFDAAGLHSTANLWVRQHRGAA